MNGRYGKTTTGILLIVLGILALLGNIGLGDIFGEAIVAVIGLIFLSLFYVGKIDWAIYPGAFTVTVGVVILLAARGLDMIVWWPLFVAAPGVSFLLLRFSSKSNGWALYPGSVLVLLAGIFFSFSSHALSWFYFDLIGRLWPVALIVGGLVLVAGSLRRKSPPRSPNNPPSPPNR